MDRVINDFRKVCDMFVTTEKWYYAVKTTEMEKNSLAYAIGLKTVEDLNRVLNCAGVLKKIGKKKDCIEHDHEKLQEKLYNTSFNESKSQCMDDGGKRRHLFLCLGGKDNPLIKKPSDQKKGMKAPSVNKKAEWTKWSDRLKKSIREYAANSSPQIVSSASSPVKVASLKGVQEEDTDVEDMDVEDEIQSPRVTRSSLRKISSSNKVSPDKMDFTFITTAPQVQAHLQSPKRKELMSQLLSKYRNAGIADVELQELDVPPDVKAPIEMFGIPFVPHLIRVLLKSFVKTSELYPNLDLLRFNNPNDSQRVLIPLTQPISKESYRRGGSKTQILNIADRMVPASKAKTDSERKDLACERTTWLLESLVKDKDNEESIRTIAKKKFKMIEPKKMSAADVGGLIKYANLTTTQFVKVKSYTDTFFENKLFCSKDKVRELYEDAIVFEGSGC